MSELRFDGRVVIVTGSGNGLGKAYALEFARRGAKVVVNDPASTASNTSDLPIKAADLVVAEIRKAGGTAIANYDSVLYGDRIVQEAIQAWGRVDILINNAGILRDKAFHKMKAKEWDLVHDVHLKGTFMMTKAVWPYMREQKFGRIINTSSTSGIYGNFGQANYSAAKLGILGFSNTIAREGERRNILTNTIAPVAATNMTKGIFTKDIFSAVSVDHIVPLVVFLCHESNTHNKGLFEVGGGWFAGMRWQKTAGTGFDFPVSVENVKERFAEIVDFEKDPQYPEDTTETAASMYDNYERNMERLAANPTADEEVVSDEVFRLMANYMKAGDSEKAVKTCQAIYNFEITKKKKGPVLRTWGVDMKNGMGSVQNKGFSNADATFRMTDEDFVKICERTLNPQIAFLQGKMKIKGNMKKATVFTPELFPAPSPENFEKYNSPKL